jgi:hypothetical protein
MDAHERDILAKAVAERVTDNTKELLEATARWVLGVRDRAKGWLRFLCFAILVMAVSAYAKLSLGWVVLGLVALSILFEWWMRRKARKEWQRYHFAGEDFRFLLGCRKTLQGMTKEERGEVKPDIVRWFLSDHFPGGVKRFFFWDGEEREGIFFPALNQIRLESMGLEVDQSRTIVAAEYAYKKYSELDPDLEWIRKLRARREESGQQP